MEIPKDYKAFDIRYLCLLNALYYEQYCIKLNNILQKYIKNLFWPSYIYSSTVIMDIIIPKDKKKVMNDLKRVQKLLLRNWRFSKSFDAS